MPTEHIVQQGECISSIAMDYGHSPDTIWDVPENAELKGRRRNPNVLYRGDVVVIPDQRERYELRATDVCHSFRRKGVPERLHVRLLDEFDQPRADLPYLLTIDGRTRSGNTDANGELEEPIPPDARSGTIVLGDDQSEEIPLNLGHLDPITEIHGIQQRLVNLSYMIDSDSGTSMKRRAMLLSSSSANTT